MNKIGIDVSSYQGKVDWKKVKADGIAFAVLKIIKKDLQPDIQFENNWNGCKAAGVDINGVYNYSYATTVEKAKTDARKVLSTLNGRKATVWLDVEDNCQKNLGKLLIDIINAYADVIKSAGLEFGVYTGQSFYNSYIKPYGGVAYPLWIARYGKNNGKMEEKYRPQIDGMIAWQYTSKSSVKGISGNVDMNIWYGVAESEEKEMAEVTVYAYSKAKQGGNKLSENFKVKEFACKDGSDVIFVAPKLVEILQKIRAHFGKPLIINSAYRTPTYNKKIGGATYSQHQYGTAADIRINGVRPKEVAAYAETLLPNTGGIGIYSNFTHIDVRAVKSRWNG